MSKRIRITGWCNPGNPHGSHARCTGDYSRGPAFDPTACECPCHDVVDQAVAGEAPAPRLGVYDVLDEVEYHADPTSVSASGMKTLLRSPAHFLHAQTHPQTSAAMDLGTVAHSMVLGTGAEYVAIEGNRNRNDVKAAITEAEAEGKVVLKPEQLAAAERMADAVLTHTLASRLLASPGRSEVSLFWHDEEFDVIRRCRWDRLGDDGIGVDLKSTAKAAPEALARHVIDYRYELAACWYAEVTAGLSIDLAAFSLVWVESTEPHNVVVSELAPDFWDRGSHLVRRALATYRRCIDTGEWPGYLPDDQTHTIEVPRWAGDAA